MRKLVAAVTGALVLTLPAAVVAAPAAQARPAGPTGTSRITTLTGLHHEPAFGGKAFGDVGTFTVTTGVLHGVVDPRDPRNAAVTDLRLAPRNAAGLVEYTADFRLYTPDHPERGNGGLFTEVVNRGGEINAGTFGEGGVLAQGFSLLALGWQGDLTPGPGRLRLTAPVATDHGRTITGPVRAEFLNDGAATVYTQRLSQSSFVGLGGQTYPAVSLSNAGATFTHRLHEGDPRVPIPRSKWSFGSCPDGKATTPSRTDICYPDGFRTGELYELVYRAQDPTVLGLGLTAIRDAGVFFRTAATDDAGTANPLGFGGRPDVRHDVLFGVSQSGRLVRTVQQLGFNSDARHHAVYDALWPEVATGRLPLNVRFGQPGRAYGQHEDHQYPAHEFPFSFARSFDPYTGRYAGLLDACTRERNCPKVLSTVHSTEYWQGRGSLDTTDVLGLHDLRLPANVRAYLISGTQHGPAGTPARGICQQLSDPAPVVQTQRALLADLDAWLRRGVAPPPSTIPTLRDHTLVPRARTGFPKIPGVTYASLVNEAQVLDFGPRYDGADESGVIDREPPRVRGSYRVLVPRTDRDGNDLGGIRSTTLAAPTGTYTGWNLRAAGHAEGELCGLTGSYVPFATTRAERLAAGDPRLSLEERYGDEAGYVRAVRTAADDLVRRRFLLRADADQLVAAAEQNGWN